MQDPEVAIFSIIKLAQMYAGLTWARSTPEVKRSASNLVVVLPRRFPLNNIVSSQIISMLNL